MGVSRDQQTSMKIKRGQGSQKVGSIDIMDGNGGLWPLGVSRYQENK